MILQNLAPYYGFINKAIQENKLENEISAIIREYYGIVIINKNFFLKFILLYVQQQQNDACFVTYD